MLHKYYQIGLILLCMSICLGCVVLPVDVCAAEERITLQMRQTDGQTYGLCAAGLSEVVGKQPFALLVTLNLPVGAALAVEAAVPTLAVTVHVSDGTARVLIDGGLPPDAGDVLLFFSPPSEQKPPALEGVSGYVRRTDGRIEAILMRIACLPETSSAEIETAAETPPAHTSVLETLREPDTEAEPSTVAPNMPDPPVPQDPAPAGFVYRGCCETAVDGGTFAVRLLFSGNGEHLPAVWIMGGGSLSLTSEWVEIAGERYLAMTYRGLPAGRVHDIFVADGRGSVAVTYRNGVYAGVMTDQP